MTWKEYMKTENGYEAITTFWEDFSIADRFGVNAVRDTYNRAFNEWKTNVKYITELVIVLNHKMWAWTDKNREMGMLYKELWEECQEWCWDNLKGEDLDYFYHTTD